jgi:hypothetical protein
MDGRFWTIRAGRTGKLRQNLQVAAITDDRIKC